MKAAELMDLLRRGNPTHPIPARELIEVRETPAPAIFCIRMQTAEIAHLRTALERIGNPNFVYACDDACCDDAPAALQHRIDDARAALRFSPSAGPK
ncbi:MAG: hypothetical protein KGL39_15435 [Patescibacteria group bacterium]|nr:hypothetical protein [Patescibacteria group bacterium]